METFFGVIVGLLILVVLVVIHELGHAIMAKRNGVVVEEFGVGFPPRAWKKKLKNGVLLSINWLPLGGFVKLQGEYDAADKKGDYGAASFGSKTKILFAGVAVNWLFAAMLLTILAWVGLPEIIPNQARIASDTTVISKPVEVVSVTKDHPAEKIGIKIGDTITKFAGQEIVTVEQLIGLTKENKGKNVEIVYIRDDKQFNKNVTLGNVGTGGYLGAGLGQRQLIKATWSAPIVGVATTAQLTWLSLQGLGDLVANMFNGLVSQLSFNPNTREKAAADLKEVGDSVAGPIGILGTIFPAAQKSGITQLMLLTAVISLSLAVMNALPIPALDGGRWFTKLVFKLSKKKLTKEREEKIQSVGFLVLMGLIILVTFSDVAKLF
jgi:regulator of sigma E protease